MSVHAGIWNFDGEPVNREFLAKVSQSLAEYGPDGDASYVDGSIGMFYRPFHTTWESHVERQPYLSASGKIITWDGRLDNRNELIRQLCSDLTDDRTDVAIVAAAFDRWGTDCFANLIGDWGLAIWDPHLRELILGRDYIGIKHLFYYPTPRRVIWCNHLAPLALCGDEFTLCDEYIAGYLASYPDAHLTPYREIQSVPPGKFAKIRRGATAIHTYWELNKRFRTRYNTDAEYEEQYRHLFRKAVRRRLRADSPVLADLSGGFDSSSIVCMGDDILAKEGAETSRLDTFSFHYSKEPEEDDFVYFTKVEERRGRSGFHADLQGSGDSLVVESPVFVARPDFRRRAEIKEALSNLLKQHQYSVLLSGSGGDDVNGQGLDPRIPMGDLLVQLRLVQLAKQLTAWSLLIRKRPWVQLFLETLLQIMPVSVRTRLTEEGKVEPWIKRRFARLHRLSARQIDAVDGLWFYRPSVREALQTIGLLTRRMSCAEPSVIEQRYPYLDQELVEFLMSIPLDQLVRPGQRRRLMRKALADLLPPEILKRKIKARVGRCYSVGLEKHWSKVESVFSFPFVSLLGYVERDQIRQALLAMKNGQAPQYSLRLLNALSLEFWLRDTEARGVISIHSPMSSPQGRNLVASRAQLFLNRTNGDRVKNL